MIFETGAHYPIRLDQLPAGWVVGYVEEFASEIETGFASGEHNQIGAGVAHLRPMNVDREGKLDLSVVKYVADERGHRRLRPGDVLFNNTNSPELVGKTTVVSRSGDFAFSNHMTRIRFSELVLPKFGALQLHFLWMRGYYRHHCSKHVNQASISSKTLAQTVPFVCAPISEQEGIVSEIEKQFSRLDEAVANLQRVKANLKRYRTSVLKAAVDGLLVPTEAAVARSGGLKFETGAALLARVLNSRRIRWSARGKCSEAVAANTSELPVLADGWVWATVEQVSDFITKGTTPSPSRFLESAGEVQFLKVYNLTFDGSLNTQHKPAFVSSDTHNTELARSKVRPGDVLMNIVGPPLGQVSVVPDHLFQANINQAIARIRPVEPLDPRFVAIALMSEQIMGWAIRRAKTTVGQSNLTLELCRALPIPLPPLSEQHRIVAEVDRRLTLVREVEAQVDANLKRAQALRQAVLARAFGGPINTPEVA